MGVDMYKCDHCEDVVHSDYMFHFGDELICNMFEGFNKRKLRDYLTKEMNIESQEIKNKLEAMDNCSHSFCDHCFKIDKAWLEIEGYKDSDEYFNFYKLTLKSLMEFSCKRCEEKQNMEKTFNDFNHFKRETKNLLELLKSKTTKSIIINKINDFMEYYYKKDE